MKVDNINPWLGKSYLIFDIESSMKPRHNPWVKGSYLSCIAAHYADGTGEVFWFNHQDKHHVDQSVELDRLQAAIDRVDVIVAHNAKFDLNWLRKAQIDFEEKEVFCTMLADYLINGQRKIGFSLDACCERRGYGQKEDKVKTYWDDGIDTEWIPSNILESYALQDVKLTNDLYLDQLNTIEDMGLTKLAKLSFDTSVILSEAESRGIMFDVDEAKGFLCEYRHMLDDIEHEVCDVAGVNINVGSGQQLSSVLYGGSIKQEVRELRGRQLKSGKFKVTTRKGTYNRALKGLGFKPIKGTECKNGVSWKTDVGTLKFLRASSKKQKQILELLTTRSKYGKIVSTFESVKKSKPSGLIHQVGNDGRIHPSFNQTTTVTGRLSSSNPNAQNLPRKGTSPIKQVFKSQRGKIVNVDLSQIEFRIGAALSNDVVMKDEIKHGLDTHSDNAEKFFKKNKERDGADEFKAARQAAKTMTFRLLYGGTANGFAKDPTMPKYSKDEWQDIVTQYFDKYKILHAWQQRNIKSVMTYGALRNPSGRIFVFDRKRGYDNEMTYNPAEACNYPVQSASADLIFLAMRELMQRVKRAKLRCDFIITVHDSVVFDCHDDDVQKLCELGLQTFRDLPKLALDYFDWEIDVPLTGECEVGDTYGSMKAVFPCKHCGKFGRHNEDDPICPDCANAYDVAA